MDKLRLWTASLILWLTFLFNFERVIERISDYLLIAPVNITYSYTYIFILITTLFAVLLPNLTRRGLGILILIFVILYLLLTLYFYREGVFSEIPRTITQLAAIGLTALLGRQINNGLREIEENIKNITINYIGQLPASFTEKQGTMYTEVKRARLCERPISMIALEFNQTKLNINLPKLIEEVQRAMMKQFFIADMARILTQNTRDFDMLALYENCFLILLPEIESHNAEERAKTLTQIIKQELDVNLQVGIASYPDNAITFEGMVATAMNNAKKSRLKPPPNTAGNRYLSKNNTNNQANE